MMLLCFALLLGTTFAWFTDNTSSSAATITSGNLDVTLEYATQPATAGGKLQWKTAEENNLDLFGTGSNALWEPGYTGIVYLRVKNTGSLALKYQYTVDVTDNKLGTNQDSESIDLTKYLKLAVKESNMPATDNCAPLYADRDEAEALFNGDSPYIYDTQPAQNDTEGWKGTAYTSTDGNLEKGKTSNIIAVVVHMPDNVDNAANHNGTNVPSIKLQVNLKATQYSEEADSFNKEYDSTATYPTGN